MLTVQEICEKYPDPSREDDPNGKYCVGGALLMYRKPGSDPFPGPWTLARALWLENPSLSTQRGSTLACSILKANDQGHFEEAWDTLALALREGRDIPAIEEEENE
jgi:hypothetical protein